MKERVSPLPLPFLLALKSDTVDRTALIKQPVDQGTNAIVWALVDFLRKTKIRDTVKHPKPNTPLPIGGCFGVSG